jgi:site-specific recombinase XerD
MKSAVKNSGIKVCRFHDLRHTFASGLVMRGVDISTVKELLGHKDIRMTMRYSHPTPEHKKEAVEKLELSQNCHNSVTIINADSRNTNEYSELAN